jgi:hypothetical protein
MLLTSARVAQHYIMGDSVQQIKNRLSEADAAVRAVGSVAWLCAVLGDCRRCVAASAEQLQQLHLNASGMSHLQHTQQGGHVNACAATIAILHRGEIKRCNI